MTSTLGTYATIAVNQADFTRYSRVSVRWQLLYVPLVPVVFTFISFIGVAASSAGQAKYGGDLQWDPIVLITYWESRAARFFAAASFALAAVGLNISANSLSAANDLMVLIGPQWVNIRRGQLICAVLCWGLVPWKILQSAGSFLNFLSAYAVFLGPIAGILLVDFWILHRRKYDVRELYRYGGRYHYWHGVNWRAWVAFVVSIAPTLPGLAQTVAPDSVDVGVGVRPFQIGWLLSFVAGCGVYLGLSYGTPAKETFVDFAVTPDEVYEVIEGRGVNEDREPGKGESSSTNTSDIGHDTEKAG